MPTPHPPTVTLQFTQALLQNAGRLGVNLPGELLAQIPDDGRAPLALQDMLWEALCEGSDDPLAGLQLGLALQVGHLDLVGLLLMSCETLGEALDALLDYHPIVGEGGEFRLAHRGPDCHLIYQPLYRRRRRERVEAVMAGVLSMARWITGGAFNPNSVQFAEPPGDQEHRYRELLATAVAFDAPANALVFGQSCQTTPLIQANAGLRDELRPMADRLLAGMGAGSLSNTVAELIRRQPRWGRERIAGELGISGRHLVRRLQEEGSSFKLLRARCLQTLAEQGLTDGQRLSELSQRLGFSDDSAFTKAFKRWTGTTPAQFRAQQEAG